MQIRQAVGETRPVVQERERGRAGHPRVTIRSSGADTFKETKDAAHLRVAIQSGNQLQLRGARIGEADSYSRGEGSLNQGIGGAPPHGTMRTGPTAWSRMCLS